MSSKRLIPAILQCFAVSALILALAGLQISHSSQQSRILILLDASASMTPFRDKMEQEKQVLLRQLTDQDKVSLAIFSDRTEFIQKDVRPTDLLNSSPQWDRVGNWSSSLQGLANVLKSEDPENFSQIFILTDGQLTNEVPWTTLQTLSPDSHWSIVNCSTTLADARLSPARLSGDAQQQYLGFDIFSNAVMTSKFQIRAGTNILHSEEIQVSPVLPYSVRLPIASMYRHLSIDLLNNDAISENNHVTASNPDPKQPRALLISNAPSPLPKMAPLFNWQIMPAAHFSSQYLTDLKLLVINNISANEFSNTEQEQILNYINSGGHLVMMGLEQHLGLGAWAESKLAVALPVNCKPKRHEPVTVLLLIDSSGSMDTLVEKQLTRLQVVESAILDGVIPQLKFSGGDHLGIMAFNKGSKLILDPTAVNKLDDIQLALQHLQASGKTALHSALQDALKTFDSMTTERKHLMLFSDGVPTVGPTDPASYQALATAYSKADIGVTIFATGQTRPAMQAFAQAKDFRYITLDYTKLDTILQEETGRLNELLQHGNFSASASNTTWNHVNTAPALASYVMSSLKENAHKSAIKLNVDGNPLFVSWQVGLGQVAVLTTALRDDSLPNWQQWDGLANFINLILHNDTATQSDKISVQVTNQGASTIIHIDTTDHTTWALNQRWTMTVQDLNGKKYTSTARRSRADRLEATFEHLPPESYTLTLQDTATIHLKGKWFTVNYHREWEHIGPNERWFEQTSHQDNVDVLTNLEHFENVQQNSIKIDPWFTQVLIFVSILLLIIDLSYVALQRRKIVISMP